MQKKHDHNKALSVSSFFPHNRPLVVESLARKAEKIGNRKKLKAKAKGKAKGKDKESPSQKLPPLAGQAVQKQEKNLASQREILQEGTDALLKFRQE